VFRSMPVPIPFRRILLGWQRAPASCDAAAGSYIGAAVLLAVSWNWSRAWANRFSSSNADSSTASRRHWWWIIRISTAFSRRICISVIAQFKTVLPSTVDLLHANVRTFIIPRQHALNTRMPKSVRYVHSFTHNTGIGQRDGQTELVKQYRILHAFWHSGVQSMQSAILLWTYRRLLAFW